MNAVIRVLNWFLQRLGVNPVHYWLLMDLFGALSDRCEMLTQLGRDATTLKSVTRMYFVMVGLVAVLLLFSQPPVAIYFSTFLALTAFVLVSVLLTETSNSLVNPVEALVLAHQPIDGATYTAAKLSHLLRIVLYLVPGLNLVPALAGLGLRHSVWYYPLLHLLAAFGVGLLVALLCCALFGWLVRIVPPPRLKTAGQFAEMLPWLLILAFQAGRDLFSHIHLSGWPPPLPAHWIAAFCIVAGVVVVFGIRSLSADYLLRVSAIVHGAARRQSPVRRSILPASLVRLLGGPPARAGYEYVSRLMLRDWQFRRQFLMVLPMLIAAAVLIGRDFRKIPFAGPFSGAHLLPHVFGVVLFWACLILPYGDDHKAAWIFLTAPTRALGPFARGVFALLWLKLIALPHALLLAIFTWFWGILDAALFTAFSLAVATFYLALELRLVDGVPFARQPEAARSAFLFPAMVLGGIAIAIAVGLQHFLLFRSRVVLLLATLLLGAAACLLTRYSLQSFEIAMRYRLTLASADSGALYTEIS